jgi:hypothetical protein
MNRRRALLTMAAALPIALAVSAGTANAGPSASNTNDHGATPNGASSYVVRDGVRQNASTELPCDPSAPNGTAADQAVANSLAGKLNGSLSGPGVLNAYRVSCARMIVNAVRSYSAHPVDEQAAVIAVTTTIVESTIENDGYGDSTSLGLYQQLSSWGSAAQREDPTWATDAFLGALVDDYPNKSWDNVQVGTACQAVQRSGVPGAYEPQAHDGALIVQALWSPSYTPQVSDGVAGVVDTGHGEFVATVDSAHDVVQRWQDSPGGAWSNWTFMASGYEGRPVVVEEGNGALAVFARRAVDDELMWSGQTVSGGGWSSWTPLNLELKTDPTVIVSPNNEINVFGVDETGELQTTWQTSPGGPWAANWADLHGQVQGRVAVVFGRSGGMSIMARDPGGNVETTWQTNLGGAWQPWASMGENLTSDPVEIVGADGQISIFGRDDSGEAVTDWQTNGAWQPAWADLHGQISGRPTVVLAQSGGLVLFARNGSGEVSTLWQDVTGAAWQGWADLGRASTDDVSAVIAPNGAASIFARETGNGALGTYWQTGAGGPWAASWADGFSAEIPPVDYTAQTSDGLPGTVDTGHGAAVFAVDSTHQVIERHQTTAGGAWSAWTTIDATSAGFEGTPNVVMQGNGGLAVFARRAGDDMLMWSGQNGPGGAWNAWTPLNLALQSDPTVLVSPNNEINVFGVDADGGLETVWQTSPGGSWTPGGASLNATVEGRVSVVFTWSGGMSIMARDPNGVVETSWQNSLGGPWQPWTPLGETLTSDPVQIVGANGGLSVFGRDSSGEAVTAWQTAAGGPWSATGWAGLNGSITGRPTAVLSNTGGIVLYARDSNNNVETLWQTSPGGAWQGWAKLGRTTTDPISAVDSPSGAAELFIRNSATQQLATYWQTKNGGPWATDWDDDFSAQLPGSN